MKLKSIERVVVIIFIVGYALAAILVSLNRFWQFNAFWYDFGIFDSTIWQLSHFSLPFIIQKAPPNGMIVWGDHFNPSVIFLAPLYWLTDKQEIIITAQVIFVSAGAYVAYLTSRKVVKSSIVKIALIVSFLGFVGMQNALFTDVHNIVFAVLPLTLAIWAIYNRKWKLYFIFLILTIGIQENLALTGAMLGIFLILSKRNVKVGAVSFLFCAFYFFIAIKFIIPYFNHSGYAYQPEAFNSPLELITRFFVPAIKVKTMVFSFLTFGLFPLFSFSTWPLVIEQYLERFVLNSAATRWDLGFHYNAVLSPIFFLSCMVIIIKLQKNPFTNKLLKFWGAATIIIVLFLHRFSLHGPLMMATMPAFYQATEDTKFLYKFVDKIPKNKFIMIQNNLGSHFTHEKMMLLNPRYNKIKPDIIVFDVRPGQNGNNFFPLEFSQVKKMVSTLEKDNNYKKVVVTDNQFYFERL